MKQKVLVIEDQKPVREAIGEVLEVEGYDVRAIRDGFAAAEAVRKETFDLITLDLNMPSLDGMSIADAIRESPLNAKTPVIVVSAYLSDGVVRELEGKEISNFLGKPFFPDELIEEAKKVLNLESNEEK